MLIPKNKPVRDKKYLAWVRAQPCCYCFIHGPNNPHHIIGVGNGRMGSKESDDQTIPLCNLHHRELHESTGKNRTWWMMKQEEWLNMTKKKWQREYGGKRNDDKE